MLNALTNTRIDIADNTSYSLPVTGRGRAIYTVNWVLTGKRPEINYDRAPELSNIWPALKAKLEGTVRA